MDVRIGRLIRSQFEWVGTTPRHPVVQPRVARVLSAMTATVWSDVRNAWLIGPIEVVQSHRLQQLGIVDADRCRAVRTDFRRGPRGAVAFIDRPQQQAVPVAGLKLYPVVGVVCAARPAQSAP